MTVWYHFLLFKALEKFAVFENESFSVPQSSKSVQVGFNYKDSKPGIESPAIKIQSTAS